MYFIDDKKSAVKEVQRYLNGISIQYEDMPRAAIDGFYGKETEESVRYFQGQLRYEENGNVDAETFAGLLLEYRRISQKNEQIKNVINADTYPLAIGDSGDHVAKLNATLSALSSFYDIPNTPCGDFFGKSSEEAVKIMQRVLGEDINGTVSIELYLRLIDELLIRENFANAYKNQSFGQKSI